MKPTDAITAMVEVAVDPQTAFAIFTHEIGRWWRPGPINWNDPDRAVGMRIEPFVGGRWIEVFDNVTGEGFECGRVMVWEPGARVVFSYTDAGHDIDGTEVEIRFDSVEGGTKVTLEHRGWDRVARDLAVRKREGKRWGWANILGWYKEWAFWGSPRRVHESANPSKGYVLQADEGLPGTDASVKASRLSTAGVFTLIESRTTGGAPMHVHTDDDEFFYVVEGTITIQCGDDDYEAGPRSFVYLPRGIPHAWDVKGDVATLLMMTVPAGLEEFLGKYHAAESSEAKDQVSAQYGITWIRS